jgi:hypothetical protein
MNLQIENIPNPLYRLGQQVVAKGIFFYNIFVISDAYFDEISYVWRYKMHIKGFHLRSFARGEDQIRGLK